MKKILVVFGTRPEAIKMAPVVKACMARPELEVKVCVTAQHRQMLDQVMEIFGLKADFDLNVMAPNQTLGDVTCKVLKGMEGVFAQWKPDMNGIGIGPVYCYSRENVFRALRRAAERNEVVTFFSHSIKPGNTDWVGMRTEWLEEILSEAKRLGLAVVGFDEL